MRSPDPGEYREQWKEYRRRRNLMAAVFLGYVPIGLAFGVMTRRVYNSSVPSLIVALVWLGLFLATFYRSVFWPCPRCGQAFAGSWYWNTGFLAKVCRHCGLEKYAGK